jgi:V/A-type H+-transporting ATPase subunit A
MIREDFLQQSAYSDTDSFCPMEKQYLMLKVIMTFYAQVNEVMNRGISLKQIQVLPLKTDIGRMKDIQDLESLRNMIDDISRDLATLEVEK